MASFPLRSASGTASSTLIAASNWPKLMVRRRQALPGRVGVFELRVLLDQRHIFLDRLAEQLRQLLLAIGEIRIAGGGDGGEVGVLRLAEKNSREERAGRESRQELCRTRRPIP